MKIIEDEIQEVREREERIKQIKLEREEENRRREEEREEFKEREELKEKEECKTNRETEGRTFSSEGVSFLPTTMEELDRLLEE